MRFKKLIEHLGLLDEMRSLEDDSRINEVKKGLVESPERFDFSKLRTGKRRKEKKIYFYKKCWSSTFFKYKVNICLNRRL